MNDASKPKRPSFVDKVGKLCYEGKDVAAYLYQVPADEDQRQRMRTILDAILGHLEKTKRRELPGIARDLKEVLAGPPTIMAAEQLQDGFDRMVKLWEAARSGLF